MKRCGKTTALHVLAALVHRPLPAANVTAAALFRSVEQFRPTLLIDEADSFLRDREELRGVLNSGHVRASAVVVRTVRELSLFFTILDTVWSHFRYSYGLMRSTMNVYNSLCHNDAGGENRTHKGFLPGDFKSPAFAISPPRRIYFLTPLYGLRPTRRTGLGDKLGDKWVTY